MLKHKVHQRVFSLLERHWKRHAPPHPHGEEETVAVPEFHTGKVHHPDATAPEEESIHYDNVAIPEVHIPHKKK